MQQKLSKVLFSKRVIFKKYANLEFLNNLENCLLIIDNSCVEIFSDKEFVKLHTAGRYKNNNVI